MELILHPVQAEILLTLLFEKEARFSDLNRSGLTSDHFNFHIKRLLTEKLIEKVHGGEYRLTVRGKEFANRFDTESANIEKQAKIGVLICTMKKERGIIKYLVQQRLKEPYFGHYGFMTGKVRWGETIYETAGREFLEETGYKGKFELVGIKHKMDSSKEGNLLEDKFFFVFGVTNPVGKLIRNPKGGRNVWLPESEIRKLPDLFDGVDETMKMVKKKGIIFSETKYKVSRF